MAWLAGNIRLAVLTFFLAVGSITLGFALFSQNGECYVKCSPVIEVTNYSYFQQLLSMIVKNYIVSRFKTYLAEKLDIEYMTGSFMNMMNNRLTQITNFSSVAESIMNQSLESEMNFIRSNISVEAFTNRLNSAALNIVGQELRKQKIDERDIKVFLKNYESRFLNSRNVRDNYANHITDFQSMAGDFMPSAANLTSRMSSLSGKMDVADGLKSLKGSNDNTRAMLAECADHMNGGLKAIASMALTTLAEPINETFSAANREYLAQSLKKITSGTGGATISDAAIEKIISRTNSAAVQTVPEFVAQSTTALANIGSSANMALGRKINDMVQSALSAIDKASSIEKNTQQSIDHTYRAIETDIRALANDARRFESLARDKSQPSIIDEMVMKKIMALIANRSSSAVLKKIAIKHYIIARTSQELALTVKARLIQFNPAAIDSAYNDMAWKDLTRFNYYLLLLENQKMKLLAVRAIIEAIDTDDPDVLAQINKNGLPSDF